MCHQSLWSECLVLCVKSSGAMLVHKRHGSKSNSENRLRSIAATILSRESRLRRWLGLRSGILSTDLRHRRQLFE